MLKVYIKKIFLFCRLLPIVEKVNFQRAKLINLKKNRNFSFENPTIILPPDYYMYETFALDYHKIYYGGLETAEWVTNHFKNHFEFKNKKILDWGCGSGRIIRHISTFIDNSNSIIGTDYNLKYTTWCKENI